MGCALFSFSHSSEVQIVTILGIDPGYAIVGWGVLDYQHGQFQVKGYGAITTPAGLSFEKRLEMIYKDMCVVIGKYKPEALSIEKLFFTNNKTTGIDVAQARGVILLAAALSGISVYEYTPPQVKQAVVGYGKAEKKQVMEMTRMLLKLREVPKPDDTADALALAVCHAHCSGSSLQNRILEKYKLLQQ